MARRYYLNDFPEPFVVNGKPDFAVIFGMDSRASLGARSSRFADITDAVNFMNLSFLLGRAGFHELPQDCVFVENWLRLNEIQELKKRNLILVGSGKVNSLWQFYEGEHRDILTLTFDYDQEGTPKTIGKGEKILYRSKNGNERMGFVQIATNPDSPEKAILFIAGFHGQGTSGACLALAKRLEDIKAHSNVTACITKPIGTRRVGDVFDDAQILEVITSEETIEQKEHLKQLLKIYIANLRKLEERIAFLGGEIAAPPWLLNQRDFTANEIERIERELQDP
jgi:hypothetical protein